MEKTDKAMELPLQSNKGKTVLIVTTEFFEKLKEYSKAAPLADSATPPASEVAELTDKVAKLESPEHRHELVTEWASGLTADSYIQLGRELGFEVSAVMGDPGALSEARLWPNRESVPPGVKAKELKGIGVWVRDSTAELAERFTKKDAIRCFELLLTLMRKKQAKDYNDVGGWRLDFVPMYGGVVVEEIMNKEGGISHPLGSMRRKPEVFCQTVSFLRDAIYVLEQDGVIKK